MSTTAAQADDALEDMSTFYNEDDASTETLVQFYPPTLLSPSNAPLIIRSIGLLASVSSPEEVVLLNFCLDFLPLSSLSLLSRLSRSLYHLCWGSGPIALLPSFIARHSPHSICFGCRCLFDPSFEWPTAPASFEDCRYCSCVTFPDDELTQFELTQSHRERVSVSSDSVVACFLGPTFAAQRSLERGLEVSELRALVLTNLASLGCQFDETSPYLNSYLTNRDPNLFAGFVAALMALEGLVALETRGDHSSLAQEFVACYEDLAEKVMEEFRERLNNTVLQRLWAHRFAIVRQCVIPWRMIVAYVWNLWRPEIKIYVQFLIESEYFAEDEVFYDDYEMDSDTDDRPWVEGSLSGAFFGSTRLGDAEDDDDPILASSMDLEEDADGRGRGRGDGDVQED